MIIAAYIFSVILIVIGVVWYRREPVSAGYPALLLVIMGIFGIVATWSLS